MHVRTAIVDFDKTKTPISFFKGLSGKMKLFAMTWDEAKTLEQVNYLWGLFDAVEDHTGQSRQEIYEHCLKMLAMQLAPFTLSKFPKCICSWFIRRCTKWAYDYHGISYPPIENGRFNDYYLL